jgi:hypothetical protein
MAMDQSLTPAVARSGRFGSPRGPWARRNRRRQGRRASSSIFPAATCPTERSLAGRDDRYDVGWTNPAHILIPNTHVRGFRAGVDAAVDPGQSTDLRVFLRAGAKALTETWTFPWRA